MSRPKGSKQAGGWTTRREPDGILLHIGTHKVGVKDEDKEKPIWIEKSRAVRLAHTILEAMVRFWDIDLQPHYVRNDAKNLAENAGLEVSVPYRKGCPFCQYVADDESEMYKHLCDEHSVTLIRIDEGDTLYIGSNLILDPIRETGTRGIRNIDLLEALRGKGQTLDSVMNMLNSLENDGQIVNPNGRWYIVGNDDE